MNCFATLRYLALPLYAAHGRTGVMVAIYRVVVEGWTKADAIDEMTWGGYGFRPVWLNLVRYVQELDVEAIWAEVVAPDE